MIIGGIREAIKKAQKSETVMETSSPSLKISECFMFSIDISDKTNAAVLSISKHTHEGLEMIDILYGKEAIRVYNKLIKPYCERRN